ncbi:Cell death protease [Entomophthora muscae]|uniref:Cell death protease n=1 Tax=Entomophthora muscae TaxID=34485 RepID=A0ACC2S2J8_9FUNG|nr:Cell death protease [Entomophthora muscae]
MFAEFLAEFFDLFPEYAHDEVYIGGESFAGVWIPTFANKIMHQSSATKVNVKGLAIGSGWIDPKNQYPSLLPLIETQQLLKGDKLEKFRSLFNKCLVAIESSENYMQECEDMSQRINSISKETDNQGKETCINQYDFGLRDEYPKCGMGWPPNVDGFHKYMGSKEVAAALHAKLPDDAWGECNPKVPELLSTTNVTTVELFPGLLENLSILLFVGDKDLMVNSIGMGYLVRNFTASESKRAPRLRVSDPEEGIWYGWGNSPKSQSEAGLIARWGRLSHATIYNASHMASYDKPSEVAGLLRWFIDGQPSTPIIPNQYKAPGFYLHSPKKTEESLSQNDANPTQEAVNLPNATSETTNPSPSPAVLGFAFVATLGVLICLAASLLRSRIRRPFNPDAQELLTTDDTELAATHFNTLPSGNEGDDYNFEFRDSDEETPVLPAL